MHPSTSNDARQALRTVRALVLPLLVLALAVATIFTTGLAMAWQADTPPIVADGG